MKYIRIENNEISAGGETPVNTDTITSIPYEDEEIYYDILNTRDDNKYIVDNGEIVLNPNWEQEQAIKRRQQLDAMTLTPADVERALYKAKGMDFDDLQSFIAIHIPTIDIKALKIEFRAKDFYRGATLSDGKTRLFDAIGALLNYSPEDMDYLFEHKELPAEELLDDEEVPF